MKRNVLFGLLSVLLVFTSCKSKESAYKQAYEKAKAQESTQVQVNAPMQVTPVATAPAEENYDAVMPGYTHLQRAQLFLTTLKFFV